MASDDIGNRGQNLFDLLMTQFCGRDEPFFRPRFLGDKYPTFDYVVEVADHPAYFFFAQVKATTKGYTKKENRLIVELGHVDVDRMIACPAPTYLIGIDANEIGLGYLLSINEPLERISSLTTKFRLECSVLEALRDEVVEYWTARNMTLTGSRFQE